MTAPFIATSLNLAETESALREIRRLSGVSNFDTVVRKLNRERVSPEREKRKRFAPSMYRKLFDKQEGICPLCDNHLTVPAKKNEIDHRDPHREDFNHESNLQLVHGTCNRKKSSASVYAQSKSSGKSFAELAG